MPDDLFLAANFALQYLWSAYQLKKLHWNAEDVTQAHSGYNERQQAAKYIGGIAYFLHKYVGPCQEAIRPVAPELTAVRQTGPYAVRGYAEENAHWVAYRIGIAALTALESVLRFKLHMEDRADPEKWADAVYRHWDACKAALDKLELPEPKEVESQAIWEVRRVETHRAAVNNNHANVERSHTNSRPSREALLSVDLADCPREAPADTPLLLRDAFDRIRDSLFETADVLRDRPPADCEGFFKMANDLHEKFQIASAAYDKARNVLLPDEDDNCAHGDALGHVRRVDTIVGSFALRARRILRDQGIIDADHYDGLLPELDHVVQALADADAFDLGGLLRAMEVQRRRAMVPPATPETKAPQCRIIVQGEEVFLDGEHIPLDLTPESKTIAILWLQTLSHDWKSESDVKRETPGLNGNRLDLLKKKLPKSLQNVIETNRRKGSRIKPAVRK